MFGIKLGTNEEIDAIFSKGLYPCFKVYELPSSLLTPRARAPLDRARADGVRFTVHAPHPFNSPIDLASPDDDIRESSVAVIEAAMDAASRIAPEAFVVHCGVTNNPAVKNGADGERTRREALSTALESLREIADCAMTLNLPLTIENDAALPGIKAASNGDSAESLATRCSASAIAPLPRSQSGSGTETPTTNAVSSGPERRRGPA